MNRGHDVARTQHASSQQVSVVRTLQRIFGTRNLIIIISLWSLGLVLCFLVSSPVTISDQAQEHYNSFVPEVSRLSDEYHEAQMRTYQAKGWFWWFSSQSAARVYSLREEENQVYNKLFALQKKQGATVGLWSEYGIEEARALMWNSFYQGTGMAKAMTYYDAFFIAFRSMGRDDGILSIVLELLARFVMNLVIGFCMSFISFLFAIVSLIQRFSPGLFEGTIFFLLAALALGSLMLTALAGVCGCCVGTSRVVGIKMQRNIGDRRRNRTLHRHRT